MPSTPEDAPWHEALRARLELFDFTRTPGPHDGPFETWTLGDRELLVVTDPGHGDYRACCEAVSAALAPLERAYELGRQDEAVDAMARVWEVQEQFDANEALALPGGTARRSVDLLEDAAHAAGGSRATAGLMRHALSPAIAPCGCVRCTDERAAAQRADGVPFTAALGSLGVMCVCGTCGNKRCPRATWHGHSCTGSNDPGQPGSRFENWTSA